MRVGDAALRVDVSSAGESADNRSVFQRLLHLRDGVANFVTITGGKLTPELKAEILKGIPLARLTSKRKKTLDDHREIGRVEWMGGLYLDEKLRPCLPGEVIEGALVSGAKKFKLGKDAKGEGAPAKKEAVKEAVRKGS